jgi:hypothetical protein
MGINIESDSKDPLLLLVLLLVLLVLATRQERYR